MVRKNDISKERVAKILFADASIESIDAEKTLPSKFKRMLKKLELDKRVKDKNVCIKMHFGGYIGYTTIHPVFVRILVQELKDAGAKSMKVIDNNPADGLPRGYTEEVLGCPVVGTFGQTGKYFYKEKIGFKTLNEVELSGEAIDSDFFLDLSHVKGHGACGFGGAIKNISMGLVTQDSRGKIHNLEGGLVVDKKKCKFCLKCYRTCRNNAITVDKKKKEISIFLHNCTFCQHCILVCPEHALRIENDNFGNFAKGMAIVATKFLKKFKPENLLFINFLTNITMLCDCWGFSTPPLVPDIGILASEDIAAIETASLDMIKSDTILPNGLPKNRELVEGKHLFEKIHGKDPYLMIKYLTELYDCTMKYEILEIK